MTSDFCRMCVNNDKDLAVCRREINIISNLTGHKNLICYVDRYLKLMNRHEILIDDTKYILIIQYDPLMQPDQPNWGKSAWSAALDALSQGES